MNNIMKDRFSAEAGDSFMVFVIGLRANELLALRKWVPAAWAMGPMLKELYSHQDKDFLGAENFLYWRGVASSSLAAFQTLRGFVGSVGIWHEAFLAQSGCYETSYANMPVFGLAKATSHLLATGRRETARRHLGR